VKNHRAARDPSVPGSGDHFIDGLVELWITNAHDHYIRGRHFPRQRSRRSSDARRTLAMKADDFDPRSTKGAEKSAPHVTRSDDENPLAH
jgi:hypothetical protein